MDLAQAIGFRSIGCACFFLLQPLNPSSSFITKTLSQHHRDHHLSCGINKVVSSPPMMRTSRALASETAADHGVPDSSSVGYPIGGTVRTKWPYPHEATLPRLHQGAQPAASLLASSCFPPCSNRLTLRYGELLFVWIVSLVMCFVALYLSLSHCVCEAVMLLSMLVLAVRGFVL